MEFLQSPDSRSLLSAVIGRARQSSTHRYFLETFCGDVPLLVLAGVTRLTSPNIYIDVKYIYTHIHVSVSRWQLSLSERLDSLQQSSAEEKSHFYTFSHFSSFPPAATTRLGPETLKPTVQPASLLLSASLSFHSPSIFKRLAAAALSKEKHLWKGGGAAALVAGRPALPHSHRVQIGPCSNIGLTSVIPPVHLCRLINHRNMDCGSLALR